MADIELYCLDFLSYYSPPLPAQFIFLNVFNCMCPVLNRSISPFQTVFPILFTSVSASGFSFYFFLFYFMYPTHNSMESSIDVKCIIVMTFFYFFMCKYEKRFSKIKTFLICNESHICDFMCSGHRPLNLNVWSTPMCMAHCNRLERNKPNAR